MCLCEIELTRTLKQWQRKLGVARQIKLQNLVKILECTLFFYPWQWPKHSSKKEKKTEAQYHAFTWFFLHINAPDSCNLLSVCSHTRIMTACGGCLSLPAVVSTHLEKWQHNSSVCLALIGEKRSEFFNPRWS